MKLLFCTECHDIQALRQDNPRCCACRRSSGHAVNKLDVVVTGPCLVLGIDNRSLLHALREQAQLGDCPSGLGRRFTAFIIPTNATTVRKIPEE